MLIFATVLNRQVGDENHVQILKVMRNSSAREYTKSDKQFLCHVAEVSNFQLRLVLKVRGFFRACIHDAFTFVSHFVVIKCFCLYALSAN